MFITQIILSILDRSQHFVFFPIQIDRDEVVLRRQIGLKKDEYSLDKKHVRYRIGDLLFPPSSLLTLTLSAVVLWHRQQARRREPARECWLLAIQSVLHCAAGQGQRVDHDEGFRASRVAQGSGRHPSVRREEGREFEDHEGSRYVFFFFFFFGPRWC